MSGNPDWPAHNVASAVVESMRRHKRKPSDFYPTPPEATVALYPHLRLEPGCEVSDPACGTGEIARVFRALGHPVIASDIRRTGYGTPHVDFLQTRSFPSVPIITNPPFALAEDFIKRCVAFSPLTALLLKSNYWHTKSRRKLWRQFTPTAVYPVTWRLAFLKEERGDSPLMDCSWWVWRRGDPPLPDILLERPPEDLVPDLSQVPLMVRVAKLTDAIDRLADAYHG